MNPRTLETIERLSRLINESTNQEATAMLMELMRRAIADDQHQFDLDPPKHDQKPAEIPDWTDPYRYPVTPRFNQGRGCQVCGIGADGRAYGYVCSRGDCPTRITCS